MFEKGATTLALEKEENMLRVKEVAKRLAVSQMTILRLIATGSLKAYRIGGCWRVADTAVDKFLSASLTK